MSDAAPFHPGEQAMQERIGMRARMDLAGRRAIRDFMPDQHRELFEKLPWALIGSLDAHGRPWASAVVGHPGFIQTPDERTMRIAGAIAYGDPLREHLAVGASIGLIGIQLETRRRNRMNGRITHVDEKRLDVHVEQSFGNCPQYIQARTPRFIAEPSSLARARPVHRESDALSARATQIVTRADTFFIATRSDQVETRPPHGVDISHRGGKPGFARVAEDSGTVITVPDFRGNMMFNSFGNLQVDARAGLWFVDFDSGEVLMLTGTAEVLWDGPELASFAAAERLLRLRVSAGLRIENALPLRWSAPEQARQLEATGSWS
jgi:predicted pyridoxine 5'-phosphate oxidase superfamily flavin-nucleotide-binding protein